MPPLDVFANPASLEALMREAVPRCREALAERGIDLAGYTTRESADDLAALREALGADKLSLLGFSYGTHLGLTAVRRHDEFLSRVVFVGIEGPDHTRKLPSSLDTQVRKLGLLAARDSAVGSEVPDLHGLLQRVLARLADEPIVVPLELGDEQRVEVPVGPEGLRMILTWDLGDGNDFIVFPALLLSIERGDPSLLAWFVRKRGPRLSGAVAGLYLAMDGASGASPERWTRIDREAASAILGNAANAFFPTGPEMLGVTALGEDFRAPIVSDVDALLVSGTLDSNAPPYQAEEVRWGMPNATHLVVGNAGHEDMLVNPEVQRIITAFLRGDAIEHERVVLPTPRFLTIEEARERLLGD